MGKEFIYIVAQTFLSRNDAMIYPTKYSSSAVLRSAFPSIF